MTQKIIPFVFYEDCAAALDFLARAFGFEETLRFAEDDGTITHAEMAIGDAKIMMGHPGPDFRSPKSGGHMASGGLSVTVDDVDAHCERARSAGATITREPADQDYGERNYIARDPEGQQWFFGQLIKEVPPEDWGATTT